MAIFLIPTSNLSYTTIMAFQSITNQIKKVFWFFIQPIHPYLRDGLLALKVIHHNGRQPFVLGYLAPGKKAEDLRNFLITQKYFEDHFPCWNDDGEVVDIRFCENFDWQYHLRVFNDGEIRGHHEYTPESRPIAHLKDKNSTAHTKEFLEFLEGWIETNNDKSINITGL